MLYDFIDVLCDFMDFLGGFIEILYGFIDFLCDMIYFLCDFIDFLLCNLVLTAFTCFSLVLGRTAYKKRVQNILKSQKAKSVAKAYFKNLRTVVRGGALKSNDN